MGALSESGRHCLKVGGGKRRQLIDPQQRLDQMKPCGSGAKVAESAKKKVAAIAVAQVTPHWRLAAAAATA